MSKKTPARLEAVLLLNGRFKKSFDKLPLAVQRLAREAFSSGENGPLLWDCYTPPGRVSVAQRWDFEHDPANDHLRDTMWELQQAITRTLTLYDDEISLVETTPPTLAFDSDTREKRLVELRLKRKSLKAAEAEYLAAAAPELRLVVERLMAAHPSLMTPSEPVAKSSEPASRQVSEEGSGAGGREGDFPASTAALSAETAAQSAEPEPVAASEPPPNTTSPVENLGLIDLKKKPPHLARYIEKEKGIHRAKVEEINACFQYFAKKLGGKIPPAALRYGRMRHWLRENKQADTSDRVIQQQFNEEPNRIYHRKVGRALNSRLAN